ncbi:UvrD-helicase domain-containing protein [Pseudanabaena sp. UWO311]|uniref:UvrD-helicase domain-containing protein n=1 Tax=Pseudanabaena sp. UWO311 TaxID=2487337 RepID=UPI001CC203DC|nr:UvrD-helicase domain-containing protein [Pseudanabaena sp. UWO311]
MYEWRLEIFFKYAFSDLNKWRKIIGLLVQHNDLKWGVVTRIEGNSNVVINIDDKNICVYFDKLLKFSWQEFFYNFQDIILSAELLIELYEYFIVQDRASRLNENLYNLLTDEYLQEQIKSDESIIESIRSARYNSDDDLLEMNLRRQVKTDKSIVERVESDRYKSDGDLINDEFLVDKFLERLDNLSSLNEKKLLLTKEINVLFEEKFLSVDEFYQLKCTSYVPQLEYQHKKQIFIQSWVQRNNLGNKPDLEQALAIGTVNSHVQVIARAGSGKTSTLVNRAIFLQKHCGVNPSEILLLVFNRKAAQEITDRLKKYLPNDMPHVMTFHALAYAIVHPTEKLLFNAPNGGQDQSRALQSVIDDYLRDPNYYEEIKTLMMKRFREDWSKIIHQGFDKSPEEVIKFRRSLTEMGIDGKYYKSYGEKVIADFLFEHNIQFAYERHVWWDGMNYHPDFTIFSNTSEKKGVVIEYFGMKGDPDYDEMSAKKRRFWQDNFEWDFVELDPQILREEGRESFDNFLKSTLQEIMRVEFNRLSDEQIWLKIKDRAIDRFTKAVVSLMQRSRKLCLTPDQLSQKIDNHQLNDSEIGEIEWRFLNLGQDFYKSYLERLEETGEEDFDGLMQRASQTLNDGVTQFKRKLGSGDLKSLKYIMIDEYQDFSLLFYNLVQAIRNQNNEALFFCVGDDWQAINGFAGSDLHYYENFLQIFNPSQKLNIPTNYRSRTKIVEIGNKLMEGKGIAAKASTEVQGIVDIVNLAKFKLSTIEQTEYKNDSFTPAILRLLRNEK